MTAVQEPEQTDASAERPRLRLLARVAIIVFVVASLAMWGYALFGPRRTAGKMDDPAFSEAAEAICAPLVAEIDDLPAAHETPDADERAQVVDNANALLAGQIDELDRLVPLTAGGSRDRTMITEWLADWETYLDDRRAYADDLRADPDARLLETAKQERPISDALTRFADANEMSSCAPPGDVG
jgi:hypothetical protein